MKYITNISEYLDPLMIDYMLNNNGTIKPDLNSTGSQRDVLNKWIETGFDVNKIQWESFTGDNLPFKLVLPFNSLGTINWWFSKLKPGDMFPLHLDLYTEQRTRYWIACQDIQPGHVFTYGNNMLSDYKAGDVFEFDAATVAHGACNMGYIPKISLQVAFVSSDSDDLLQFSL